MAATAEKSPPDKGNTNDAASDDKVDEAPAAVPAQATERDYAVYEVITRGKVPAGLMLVAVVTADSKDAARWAAVDANAEMKARVSAKDGESGEEVYLLPIALRALTGGAPTFEEVQRVTARR